MLSSKILQNKIYGNQFTQLLIKIKSYANIQELSFYSIKHLILNFKHILISICKMSQKYHTRNNIKKFQDSFSDKYQDSDQDDTKIQPNQDYKEESKILKNEINKIQKYNPKEEEDEKLDKKTSLQNKRFRRTRSQQKKYDMENRVKELMESIDEAYQQDVALYRRKRPADKKLKLMSLISMQLKQLQLAKAFMKMNGLSLFVRWFYPNEETKQQTSLTVRIHLMNLLQELNVTKQTIENCEELENVIKKHKRSKFQVLRDASEKIVKKWRIVKALQSVS